MVQTRRQAASGSEHTAAGVNAANGGAMQHHEALSPQQHHHHEQNQVHEEQQVLDQHQDAGPSSPPSSPPHHNLEPKPKPQPPQHQGKQHAPLSTARGLHLTPNKRHIQTSAEHPALKTLDRSTAWMYTPHTLTVLSCVLAIICVTAGVFDTSGLGIPVLSAWDVQRQQQGQERAQPQQREQAPSLEVPARAQANAKAGVMAGILVFLGYSVTHGPRTSMVRPHPALWRLVHGVLVVYLLLLVYLVHQDVGDARAFLRHLHPDLSGAVSYRSYATDCRLFTLRALPTHEAGSEAGASWLWRRWALNWAALKATLLDEFVVAHLLGWWAKALVIRNHFLLWVVSIGFELIELTFAHMLPNFNECWWDSWVLDVALCNAAGIWLGMKCVRWAECKYARYNWQGLSSLQGLRAKARRSLAQLGPHSLDHFDWCQFSCPKRFLQALFVVAMVLAFELNAFFLKFALWIPPANPLNTARLIIWFLLALPAVREWYEFIEGKHSALELGVFPKLGSFIWIAIATTCVETMCAIKFGRGLYPNPWPRSVVLAWSIGLGVGVLVLVGWQGLRLHKAWGRARRPNAD